MSPHPIANVRNSDSLGSARCGGLEPGRAAAFAEATPEASPAPYVVVGGGPAGTRAAQELAGRTERPVLLFSDENWGPYNRVKLTPLLAREVGLGQVCESLDLETADRVQRMDGRRIVAIDPKLRSIRDHLGCEWTYAKLILATGSRPHRPPIPGIALSGVFTFRNLNDAQALVARAQRARHVVVIGGGLLGLEAARGMAARGTSVSVFEHESRLMARQLDQAAGDLLRHEIEALGITVRTGVAVRQIAGTLRVEGLFLSTGEEVACDTVILCTGIRPNREIALEAGLAVGAGIKVDDEMRTSDPHIFAIGECAEHGGVVDGLVAPGLEQARAAAAAIAGEAAPFRRGAPTTRLKVAGAPVFSAGDIEQIDQRIDIEGIVWQAEAPARYRRLVLRGGRIVGAIAVGPWDEIGHVQQRIARRARIWPWQLRRFLRDGELAGVPVPASVSAWPVAATVCNCTGVTRGQLSAAMASGCVSVEGLARTTSASTVCGSCRPLLQELLGGVGAPEPAARWKPLALLSMLALAAVALFSLSRPLSMPTSFAADFALEQLFIDGQLKQASGFTLLAITLLAALLSLRKRVRWLRAGDFVAWRIVHLLLGVVAIATLAAHSGFRLGSNLNLALVAAFLATMLAGSLGGVIIAFEHRLAALPAIRARRVDPRSVALWLHILGCWPLPLLLGLHIISVYFY